MLTASMRNSILSLLAIALGASSLIAQGVDLAPRAAVLSGSPANCTVPATLDLDEVREATPEWQQIEGEGVRESSARYALLSARMAQRIGDAARRVAQSAGYDLVVVEGAIEDSRGLEVEDITERVIEELGGVDPVP